VVARIPPRLATVGTSNVSSTYRDHRDRHCWPAGLLILIPRDQATPIYPLAGERP
jgi:hypothetical protein